jgi:hypothetical protein
MPSFADLAFLMPLVFLFGRMEGARSLLGDGDTGWHVRTGEWILDHGRVPDRDLFSFTRPGQPWYAWEWLWDAAFGWLHRHAGMAAVVWVNALLIALATALLYRLAHRKSGHPLLALVVTLASAAASSIHWLARPHLFTLLFLVIFATLLEQARAGHPRALAWLPVLAGLWTNLHAGFFTGILLVTAYGAGELLEALLSCQPAARRAAAARAWPYLLSAAACLAVSLINPYGWRLHAHILAYLADPFALGHIQEFQSANFRPPLARYFELLLALGAAAAFWSICRRRWTDALLVVGAGHLALVAARNVPIYAILAAPVIARALAEWLRLVCAAELPAWPAKAVRWLQETAPPWNALECVPRWRVTSLAAAVLLGTALYWPCAAPAFQSSYDPRRYPANALTALSSHEGGAIFTHDEWGDYLIYRLYPRVHVFVDGRSDFYGAPFEERYVDVMNVRWGWEEHLRRYGVDTILLPPDAPLCGALKESGRWRVVYDDGVALIFRPSGHMLRTGEPFSVVVRNHGANRDREITKSEPRGPIVPATHIRSVSP